MKMSNLIVVISGVMVVCLICIMFLHQNHNVYRIDELPYTVIPVRNLPSGSQFMAIRGGRSTSEEDLSEMYDLYPQIPKEVLKAFSDNSRIAYNLDTDKPLEIKNSSVSLLYRGDLSFQYKENIYKIKFDYNARRSPWIVLDNKLYYLYAPMTETDALPLSDHGYHIVDLVN